MNYYDLPHSQLWNMRADARDQLEQNRLADAEHYAFARELMQEKPWLAPSLLFAIPAYHAGKRMGLLGGRSDPSLNQLGSGYAGMWRGLFE